MKKTTTRKDKLSTNFICKVRKTIQEQALRFFTGVAAALTRSSDALLCMGSDPR